MNKSLNIQLEEKVQRYFFLTGKALQKIEFKKNLTVKEKAIAVDFLSMAKNYFSDAKHFSEKNDLLNSLAALSYAHAWLDAGVRAGLFDAKEDDFLFTLK
ncbi:DUF357 domain-containing protein [Candidatus Micrarchaeota archaeon]|nr:DUF357 domain-containing protein [Candidatus Micrarchaeota archaeon]MBU2476230.1 DUF357 domain-containing protein [Candidatus Micrarchaeota archaeon]